MLFYKIKTIKMNEIRTTKIDGVEFVTYKDYLRLKEENEKLKEMSGKLGEMNGKLGEWVNNLEEENKKLKERINELETTNKKRTADNWATFKS